MPCESTELAFHAGHQLGKSFLVSVSPGAKKLRRVRGGGVSHAFPAIINPVLCGLPGAKSKKILPITVSAPKLRLIARKGMARVSAERQPLTRRKVHEK
jgi:hypothetical protein